MLSKSIFLFTSITFSSILINTIIKAFNSKNIKKEYNLVIAGYGQKNKIIPTTFLFSTKSCKELLWVV